VRPVPLRGQIVGTQRRGMPPCLILPSATVSDLGCYAYQGSILRDPPLEGVRGSRGASFAENDENPSCPLQGRDVFWTG